MVRVVLATEYPVRTQLCHGGRTQMSFGSIQCRTSGVKFCSFKVGGLLKRDFTVHCICVTLSVFVHSYESVKLKYPQKMNRWK